MAYVFQNLQDILDNQNPDKQNIFAQSSPTGGNGDIQSKGTQTTPTTANAEGDLSGSNTTNASNPNRPASNTPDESSRAAYTANAGKIETPASVGLVNQKIDKANTDLQGEADSYYNTQSAKQNYSIPASSIDAGTKNSATPDFAKIMSTLGKTTADPADAFIPKTNTNVPETGWLQNQAGESNFVSAGQNENYTPGMANFDVAALQSNPNFQGLRTSLLNRQNDLTNKSNDLGTSLPKKVNDEGQANLVSAQKNIKDTLGTTKAGILDAEAKAAAAKNAGVVGSEDAGYAALYPEILNTLKGQITSSNDYDHTRGIDPYLPTNFDYHPYVTAHTYNPSDMATGDQATQFNNISSLLGSGDIQQMSAPRTDPDVTFDKNGILNALNSSYGNAWGATKSNLFSTAQPWLDEASKAADAQNAKNSALTPEQAAASYWAKVTGQIPDNLKGAYDTLNRNIGGIGINPTDFLTKNPNQVTQGDELSQEAADALNKVNTRAGLQPIYKAGQVTDPYSFDSSTAFSKLTDLLNGEAARQAIPLEPPYDLPQDMTPPRAAPPPEQPDNPDLNKDPNAQPKKKGDPLGDASKLFPKLKYQS